MAKNEILCSARLLRPCAVARNIQMLRSLMFILILAFTPRVGDAQASPVPAQPSQEQVSQSVEAFLRNYFAWGPTFQVKLGPFTDASAPGFYEVPVQVTFGGQSDTGLVYVSKDGRFLMRGELHDIKLDPFAENRAHLHVAGNPSIGPANAPITVVEFSDFQCPHCRELYRTLKELEPRYPQVHFVFKDFPLTQIHPWAITAALAARCAYMGNPPFFWKVHDAIFDNQELITVENAYDQMLKFATDAGMAADAFRACMISPEAKNAIESNLADGRALKIQSTPTLFVNGRPLIGGERELLEQFLAYELTPRPHLSLRP
jgi:protein-disulfide isomerase